MDENYYKINCTDSKKTLQYIYKKNDIAICPLCKKYITDVVKRNGSIISIKCPRCKKVVEIIL